MRIFRTSDLARVSGSSLRQWGTLVFHYFYIKFLCAMVHTFRKTTVLNLKAQLKFSFTKGNLPKEEGGRDWVLTIVGFNKRQSPLLG